MNDIINITERAKKQIIKISQKAPKNTRGILLGIDNSGCSGHSYKLDFLLNSDTNNYESIQIENLKIYIDPKATMFLIGTKMDFETDKLSSRFTFTNPNSKNVCGCGESFSI